MTTKTRQAKLWGGRFSRPTDARVEAFTESLSFERRLAPYDIEGSCAHAAMLGSIGVLTKAETVRIVNGLRAVGRDIAAGIVKFKAEWEDIHMAVETILTARIGPTAKKLQTGRSRNDQVALDERLYLRDILAHTAGQIGALQRALVALADKNSALVIPGFTHLQYAMPVLAAHHLLSYVEMLERDKQRLEDQWRRVNVMPLGSAALAGSGIPLDRAYVARALNFDGVSANSMDAVGDRDYLVEFLSAAAIIGMHLSRLCEDMILWVSQPFGFIDIGDAFCTGSSLMPNKKNPDTLELVRGKCGRLYGNLVSLLTVMKGLPMTYNRDMQEDKEPVFDSADTLLASLALMAALVPTIVFNKERIARTVSDDFLLATDWTDHLVKEGVPFREAHEMVGKAVARASARKCGLTELTAGDLKELSPKFDRGVLAIRTLQKSVEAKCTLGSTNPSMVKAAIQQWKKKLGTCTERATSPAKSKLGK